MIELNASQVAMVSGAGEMSTETAVIIGVTCAVSPLLGAFMLMGYYANRQ